MAVDFFLDGTPLFLMTSTQIFWWQCLHSHNCNAHYYDHALGILSIAHIDGLHCALITGANDIIKPIRWKQETLRAQHNIRRMSRDEVAKAASQGCPGKVRSKSFSISSLPWDIFGCGKACRGVLLLQRTQE